MAVDKKGVDLAARLMDYRKNPHHINPMSESFQNLLSEIVVHLTKDSATFPRSVVFTEGNVKYWSDGTASQTYSAYDQLFTDDNLQNKLEECVSQLKAQFAGQMSEWTTIETAPKDGSVSLITDDNVVGGSTALISALKAALKPFADKADAYDDIPGLLRIDESVELWQISKNKGMQVDFTVADLRRARTALASAPPSSGFVAVKPLEWEDIGSGLSTAPAPLFGNIRVEKYGALFTTCYSLPGYSNTFAEGSFATADEAKSACEVEYQKRVRATLSALCRAE